MQVNQTVTGMYMGSIPFRGVITSLRSLTVKTDGAFEHMIDLAEPVTVFGEQRTNLIVTTKFDGQPSSYTRHTDSLCAT